MQFETRYEVTESLQSKAVAQLFFSVYLKRKWIGVVLLYVAALLSVLAGAAIGFALTGFLAALGFVLTWMWVRSYQKMQQQGRAYIEALNGSELAVTLADSGVLIANAAGSQRVAWQELGGIAESKDFIILLIDRNPLICLPKSALNTEVIEWLRQLDFGSN